VLKREERERKRERERERERLVKGDLDRISLFGAGNGSQKREENKTTNTQTQYKTAKNTIQNSHGTPYITPVVRVRATSSRGERGEKRKGRIYL
jgi:hypothetical protein